MSGTDFISGSVEVEEFNAFVKGFLSKIDDPALKSKAARAYVATFIQKVVPRTPVDTGMARAGWTVAKGRVKGIGSIRIGGNDHAKHEEARKLSHYKERGLSRGKGGLSKSDNWSVEIFNGAPHIAYLELGSSTQAPSGMVRVTLREMSKDVAKGEAKRADEALRLANDEARALAGMRQGSRGGK